MTIARHRPDVLPGMMIVMLIFLAIIGCGSGSDPAEEKTSTQKDPTATNSSSHNGSSSQNSLSPIRQLISSGKMDDAHQAIQQHLIRHPDDPQALVLAAQTSFALGQTERAVGLLDAAAEAWPENRRNLKARAADLLAQSGRWRDSITRFEELVSQYPDFDGARHKLAGLLNARGFRFDANQHVRQLCRSSGATPEELRGLVWPSRTFVTFAEKPKFDVPEEVEKVGALSVARALFGQGDVRDALTVLERSDLIKDKNPCAFAFYGQVLLESQQFDKFQEWVDQTDPACERYPAFWMALGGWALHQQKYETAVRMYAEAVLREPGDVAANNRLTQALNAAGRVEMAKKFLQRNEQLNQLAQVTTSVLLDPEAGPQAVSQLTDLLARVGRPFEALAWHRLALAQMGSPPKSMEQLAAEQRRVAQAEQENPAYLQRNLLCGLELDDFPREMSWITAGRSRSTPADSHPIRLDAPNPLPPTFVNVAPEVGLDFRYRNAPVPVERQFPNLPGVWRRRCLLGL